MALYMPLGPIRAYAESPPPEVEVHVQHCTMERLRAGALRTGRLLRRGRWKTTASHIDPLLRRQHHDLLLAAWHARRCYLINKKESP